MSAARPVRRRARCAGGVPSLLSLPTAAVGGRSAAASAAVGGAPEGLHPLFRGWTLEDDLDELLERYGELAGLVRRLPEADDPDHARASLAALRARLAEFLRDQCAVPGRVLVWDLETTALIDKARVPIEEMSISVACANLYDVATGARELELAFWHEAAEWGLPLDLLPVALAAGAPSVAYNGRAFDLLVAKRHFASVREYERAGAALLDPLEAIELATGRRYRLADLLRVNGLASKLGTGERAPALWAAFVHNGGDAAALEELQAYCAADVDRLWRLVRLDDLKVPTSGPWLASTGGAGTLAAMLRAARDGGGADTRTLVQGSEAWFAARRGRVTASLAPSLLGLGPMPRDAAFDALMGLEAAAGPPTEAMRRGSAREPAIAAAAGARLGVAWRETGLWLDPQRPWLGASPDRVSADGSQLLECKSVARLPAAGPSAAQLVQVQLQMLVTGVHRAVLAIEEAGSGRLALHRVRFDAELAREQLVPPLQRLHAAAARAVAEGAAEEALSPALEPAESQRLKAALAESRALFCAAGVSR